MNGRDWLSPSADGRWLAVAWRPPGLDEDRVKLTVYDVKTGSPRFRVDGLPFVPGSLAMNGDGSIVAVAGGGDGRIQLRSGVTGELLREVDPMPKPADAHLFVNTAAVLFSGDQLIVTSQAGPIRWIDPATGTETKRIVAVPETAEYYVRPSPDGKFLATDGWAGHMLYDVTTGAAVWPAPLNDPYCNNMAWSTHLDALLCTDPHTNEVHPLDQATGVSTGTRFDFAEDGDVSPDGSTLVQTYGTTYSVWRLDGGGPVTALLAVPGAEWIDGYAPNGDVLVGQAGHAVRLVDPATGAVAGELPGVEQILRSSADGSTAAIYLDQTVGWYDLAHQAPSGPKAALPLPADRIRPVRDPDSTLLFQGGTIVDRRAVLFTNDQDDAGAHLHLRSVDLDHGTAASPTRDEGAVENETWMFAAGRSLYAYSWSYDIRRRDPQAGTDQGDLGGDYVDVIAGPAAVVGTLLNGDLAALDPATLAVIGAPFPGGRGDEVDMAISGDGRRAMQISNLGVRLYDVPGRIEMGEDVPAAGRRGRRDEGLPRPRHGAATRTARRRRRWPPVGS